MEKIKVGVQMQVSLIMSMKTKEKPIVNSVHVAEQWRKIGGVYRKIKEVRGENTVTDEGLNKMLQMVQESLNLNKSAKHHIYELQKNSQKA